MWVHLSSNCCKCFGAVVLGPSLTLTVVAETVVKLRFNLDGSCYHVTRQWEAARGNPTSFMIFKNCRFVLSWHTSDFISSLKRSILIVWKWKMGRHRCCWWGDMENSCWEELVNALQQTRRQLDKEACRHGTGITVMSRKILTELEVPLSVGRFQFASSWARQAGSHICQQSASIHDRSMHALVIRCSEISWTPDKIKTVAALGHVIKDQRSARATWCCN